MIRIVRAIYITLLIGFMGSLQPLLAQLNPQLAVTPTDFLDLYQASATVVSQNKPEICTIFDFSGSMQALMYHYQYQNKDVTDGDDYCAMKFHLGSSSTTCTITAASTWDPSCNTTLTFTIGSGNFGTSSPDTHTRTGYNGGSWSAVTNITAISYPGGTTTSTSPIQFSATVTAGATSRPSRFPTPWNNGVTWTCTSGTIDSTGKWTAPGSPLTVTLYGGDYYGTGSFPTLYSDTLVTPAGNVVTSSMVTANTTYDRGSVGTADVRNWIRCASHVRFKYTDPSNSVLRTIDIPIPWQITDANTPNGSPLTSLKVHDPVTGDQEIDGIHLLQNGNKVFCTSVNANAGNSPGPVNFPSASTTQTDVYLSYIYYRPSYINWLFTGKYSQAGKPYDGKYIVFDANPTFSTTAAGYGQTTASWGQGYGGAAAGTSITVPSYDASFAYANDITIDASQNIVPARTRCEAVKEAALRSWIAYQSQVIWAYRFLDTNHEAGKGVDINNNSTTYAPAKLPTDTSITGNPVTGNYSNWTVMNGNSAAAMQNLAAYVPNGSTPLTAALARTYAQFSDPTSVFNALEIGGTGNLPKPQTCQNHVVILFTDGLDNNGGGSASTSVTPYITGNAFSAAAGNSSLNTTPGAINTTYWNLFTMAGAAAHLADSTLGTGNYMVVPTYPNHTTADVASFLPFAIPSRGETGRGNLTTFNPPARIQTYTVGVSLGGAFSNPASPKASLFNAALMGDPNVNGYDNILNLTPFKLKTAGDPTSGPATNAIFYFDGNDPSALVNNLSYAIASTLHNGSNSASNPNLPFVGASLGQELYVGTFTPPSSASPIWPGDLLMFSTRTINGTPTIVNAAGNQVTALTSANAIWSAGASIPTWFNRKLFTRIPGSAGTPEPGITAFTDLTPGFTTIEPYIDSGYGEPLSAYTKAQVVQFIAGANLTGAKDSNNRPTTNRANVMGDIINSSPAYLEYNLAQIQANSALGNYSHLSGFTGATHFRLIIVGDNQGWVHGFGELSTVTTLGNDSNGNPIKVANAVVDELWAFMPTDFLPYLDYLTTSNTHRFMSDGSPTIYFLDMPATNFPNGNGVFDQSNNERALAIFGLRKGGRSYYALNIDNPFAPTIQWSLRPDEASLLASKTFSDGTTSYAAISPTIPSGVDVAGIVSKMGLSTCTPALGRVQYGNVLKDAVFLGGGYSVSQLDHNFPTYNPANNPVVPANQNTPLGRSILALDVWSGQILAAADMTRVKSTIGPIGNSLVPFEFFLNSGLAQRVYFNDLLGGLWAWDHNTLSTTAPYTGYRIDSSDLATWSGDQTKKVRQVYQDSTTAQNLYTALPAPFRVGSFPGLPVSSGLVVPSAVGILMASGDKNNPIDNPAGYGNETNGPTTTPTVSQPFRLTCVFDRQDSANWSSVLTNVGTSYVVTDSNLRNFTGSNGLPSLTMGDPLVTRSNAPSTYYLAPTASDGSASISATKFGYYINFPNPVVNATSASGLFIPKALSDPTVVGGAAFYSFFTPTTAESCGGGNGNTSTNIICDVINPALSVSNASCQTGNALPGGLQYWAGVPSNFSNLGTTGVIQGGAVTITNPTPNGPTTQVQLALMKNAAANQYPKVRVWRVVQ